MAIMLRHPVQRAASHFHFMRSQTWTSDSSLQKHDLATFLRQAKDTGDWSDMMAFRGFWQDGQASVAWLTGTHIAKWVESVPEKPWTDETKNLKEFFLVNHTQALQQAADRMDSIFWIGILEDMERSIELLEFQLNIERGTLRRMHLNKGTEKHGTVNDEAAELLRSLVGMDLWLYDYGRAIFEARYQHYKTGIWNQPTRPTLPGKPVSHRRNLLVRF